MTAFENKTTKVQATRTKTGTWTCSRLKCSTGRPGAGAEAEILKVGAPAQLYVEALRRPRQELGDGVCSARRRHPEPQEIRKEGTLH